MTESKFETIKRVIDLTSGLSVIATMVFIALQWREMRSGSADTHALAEAAKAQSEATRVIAESARLQAASTEILARSSGAEVEELRRNVSETHRLALAADTGNVNNMNSVHDDQRAWVGIGPFQITRFEDGKPIIVQVEVVNTGKTPALHTNHWGKFNFSPMANLGPAPALTPLTEWRGTGAIPPQGHQFLHLEIPWDVWSRFSISTQGKTTYLSVFGEFWYDDTNGRRRKTDYCLFMNDPNTHTLAFCDRWNEMD